MNTRSERDIDKVLIGIRDTGPSPDMERRILRALRRRDPAPVSLFSRWQFIAAVPVAAIALLLSIHFFASNRSELPAPVSTSTNVSPLAPVVSQPPNAPRFPVKAAHTSAPHLAIDPQSEAAPEQTSPLLSAADRRALDDLSAPSQPAPPLPLTRDERILQRAAQKSESVEIAQLDPLKPDPLQAAVTAREHATVQRSVQRFLKQLAAAEAVSPTPPDPEPNIPLPAVDSSNSN